MSKRSVFSFSIAFIALGAITSRPAQALIVGGVDMTSHDPIQRSTAAMYSPSANGPGGALCTASLIGPNMAVTAAHCVQPGSYAPVMIFGPNVRSPESTQRPIVGEEVNPAWAAHAGRGMDQGDIAVVKFGGGLPKGYKPATLDSSDDVKRGESAILAGYGVSNPATKEGAGVLRKTSVSVANARSGKPEMIFDQSHGHGACHGDSGGPAYFARGKKMVLGGVTNRSYPDSAADDCAHKVVYTKVAAYRPWIEASEDKLNHESGPQVMGHLMQPDVPVRSMSEQTQNTARAKRHVSTTKAAAATTPPLAPLGVARVRKSVPRASLDNASLPKTALAHNRKTSHARPHREVTSHQPKSRGRSQHKLSARTRPLKPSRMKQTRTGLARATKAKTAHRN